VTIEGVETDEQLALLAGEASVDEVQGYLLGRPLPAADIQRLLDAMNPAAVAVGKVA
jgi:EAL domain-containing protein (putative c-di-GMP-specific phosphodiesterase class I)